MLFINKIGMIVNVFEIFDYFLYFSILFNKFVCVLFIYMIILY